MATKWQVLASATRVSSAPTFSASGGVALPVPVWRHTDGAEEVIPQRRVGAEAGLLGDAVNCEPGGFQQSACAVDAHPGEQAQRGGAEVVPELAVERSYADRCVVGDGLQIERV